MTEFAYGLDFGTSKTSLSFARCGGARPPVTDLQLTERGDARTSTCVLYDGQGGLCGVGTPAEEHYWTFLTDEQRASHQFRGNFKPHVHTDDAAERVARDFLRAIRQSEDVRRELDPPAERVTVVGMPAGWTKSAEQKLLSLARESGFPAPRVLPEPVGALFYFLGARLRAEDLDKDVLVIDWGAGTCDFSLMHRGRPSEEDSWGSNVYGGRLFDDLFFQWFVEQVQEDPDHRDALRDVLASAPFEGTLREIRARELKEEFSVWSRKRPRSFRSRLVEIGDRELGRLRVDGFEDFEARARRFVPSRPLRDRLGDLLTDVLPADRGRLEALLAGSPVDLIAWGDALVREGGRGRVRPADVDVVVLAGGSTLWPWFQDLVRSPGIYGPSAEVYVDRQPELTIARGLASGYAVGVHARDLAARIEEARESIVTGLRRDFLEPRMDRLSDTVARRFLEDCYESEVRPLLGRLRERAIDKRAAETGLEGILRAWIAQGGGAAVESAIDQVNAESPAALERVAAEHGIRIEGLLKLAIDVCAPFGSEDWSAWVADAELSRRLVDELRNTAVRDLLEFVASLLALPFQVLGWAGNRVLDIWQSDEERALRERRQEQGRRDKAREQAERAYDDVRTRLQQVVSGRLREHPALGTWATQMQVFLREKLEAVAHLAGTDR